MKKTSLTIYFCFLTKILWAQNNIIPPAPTMTAFAKYGDIPVSTYTGIPNISIPIYTITDKGIELPISLSYHASGIKVSEEASWCGLAWSLNAGGSITHIVKGRNDLGNFTDGYIRKDVPVPNCDPPSFILQNNCIAKICSQTNQVERVDYSGVLGWAVEHGGRDLDWEPDIFIYNFGNSTGKFFFDQKGNIHLLNQDDLLITLYWDGNAPRFKIIDAEGTQYNFGNTETTANYNPNNKDQAVFTGWYLSEIKGTKGEVISLEYDDKEFISQTTYSETKAFINTCLETLEERDNRTFNGGQIYTTNILNLSKIRFSTGYIDFKANPSRQDLKDYTGNKSAHQLDTIKILNYKNEIIKIFTFNYGYYISALESTNFDYSPGVSNKRLRLDGLNEINTVSQKVLRHSFTYNSKPLPCKNSFSSDRWGFYNGIYNRVMIPTFLGIVGDKTYQFDGANRKANAEFVTAGLIERIDYPTGGYTQFSFEPNDFSNNDHTSGNYDTFNYSTYSANDVKPQNSNDRNTQNNINFTVSQEESTNGVYVTAYTDFYNNNTIECGILGNPCYDPTGNTKYYNMYVKIMGGPNFSQEFFSQSINNTATYLTSKLIFLNPGQYMLVTKLPDNLQNNQGAYATISVNVYRDSPKSLGGGARVKQVVSYDGFDHNKDMIKNYCYTLNDNSSSGLVMSYPMFHFWNTHTQKVYSTKPEFLYWNSGQIITGTSDSYSGASTSSQGSYVGYSHIKVSYGTNGENGYSIYDYINTPDRPNGIFLAGYPSFTPYNLNGKLISQTDFDANNIKKRHSEYGYSSYKTERIFGMFAESHPSSKVYDLSWEPAPLDAGFSPGTIPGCLNIFSYYTYAYDCYKVLPTSLLETIYNKNDPNQFVTTNTKYSYDNPLHMKPTLVTTSTSNNVNRVMATEYTYSLDYKSPCRKNLDNCTKDPLSCQTDFLNCTNQNPSSRMSAINQMQTNHMIAPVETRQYVQDGNSTLLTGSAFQEYTISEGFVCPVSLYTLPLSNTNSAGFIKSAVSDQNDLIIDNKYELRYNKIYKDANQIQVRKSNDIPITYLWGYNNTYPIAEIKNATYAQVQSVLTQTTIDQLASASPGTDAQVRQTLQVLRTDPRLKKAMVTTYTYAPLIGMTSKTDENNITTFFEYDAFQRLKNAKDRDGNIIKNYNYHYKGQP